MKRHCACCQKLRPLRKKDHWGRSTRKLDIKEGEEVSSYDNGRLTPCRKCGSRTVMPVDFEPEKRPAKKIFKRIDKRARKFYKIVRKAKGII